MSVARVARRYAVVGAFLAALAVAWVFSRPNPLPVVRLDPIFVPPPLPPGCFLVLEVPVCVDPEILYQGRTS